MTILYTTYCQKSQEIEKILIKKNIKFKRVDDFETLFIEAEKAHVEKAPFIKAHKGQYYDYQTFKKLVSKNDLTNLS